MFARRDWETKIYLRSSFPGADRLRSIEGSGTRVDEMEFMCYMSTPRGKRLSKLCVMPKVIALRTLDPNTSTQHSEIWLIQSRSSARQRYVESCTVLQAASIVPLDMTQWLESEVSDPIHDLIEESKNSEFPPTDAYSFAEWLVQVKDHFGDSSKMSIPRMEEAYDEAMGWWEIGNKA